MNRSLLAATLATSLAIPSGHAAFIFDRSGLSATPGDFTGPFTDLTLEAVGVLADPDQLATPFITDITFEGSAVTAAWDRVPTGVNNIPNKFAGLRVITSDALASGETFTITMSFPTGLAPVREGSAVDLNVGFVGNATPDLPFNQRLAAHWRSNGNLPGDISLEVSGVSFNGTAIDLSTLPFNPAEGFVSPAFFDDSFPTAENNIPPGLVDPVATGATFTNATTPDDGFGIGIIDFSPANGSGSNISFDELTFAFTAGNSGLAANTEFRLSLGGGPVVIPEPSSAVMAILALFGGALTLTRRRRASIS